MAWLRPLADQKSLYKDTLKAFTLRMLFRILFIISWRYTRNSFQTSILRQIYFCFMDPSVCVTKHILFTFASGYSEVLSIFLDVFYILSPYLDSSFFFKRNIIFACYPSLILNSFPCDFMYPFCLNELILEFKKSQV